MKLAEHLETLSLSELREAAIAMAIAPPLDTEGDLTDGCAGQTGCGTCVSGVWVRCS